MKNILYLALLGLFLLAAPVRAGTLFDGDWDGTITRPGGTSRRLLLHIEPSMMVCTNNYCSTSLSATLTDIDHGGAVLPASDVGQNGMQVMVDVPGIKVSYQATLSADYATLTGSWTEGGAAQSVTMTRRVGQVDRVDIVKYGIYVPDKAFTRTLSDGWHVTTTTTNVAAKLGASFGINYSVTGAPKGRPVPLRVVIVFPKEGLRNPLTGKVAFTSESDVMLSIGGDCYEYFLLDSDWEVVPGTWTFQVWYQGKKMAEKSFTVVKP